MSIDLEKIKRWRDFEEAHERDVEALGLYEGALPDRDGEAGDG